MRFARLIAAALAVALTSPASAADHLIPGGTIETAPLTLSGDGDTLTIEQGAELSVATGDAAVQVSADDFAIYNAGTISYLDYNAAIYVDSALNGQIVNSATGRIESNVVGIAVLSSTLDLLNAGSIEAVDSAVFAVLSDLMLLNSGEITGLTAIETIGGTADIMNSGEIIGTDYGIRLNATTASTLVNSGTIEGEEGIHQHGSELTVINTGTIYGSSTGFSVHNSSTLDLTNSGTIEGGDYGLFVYDDVAADTTTARIRNTGTISGGEAGVRVQSGTGHVDLVNAGTISGTTSLSIEASENTVTLLPGSILEGQIYLSDADNEFIIGKGLNVLLAFSSSGEMPANIDSSGMPYVVDPASHRIAVLDTTAVVMADEALDDLAVPVLDAVSRRREAENLDISSAALGPSQTVTAAGARFVQEKTVWAQAFGSARAQEEGDVSWSSDHHLAGLVAGLDGPVSAGRAGMFLGAANGRLEVDDHAQHVETESIYAGIHLSRRWERSFAEGVLLAGLQDNDSRRRIADTSAAGGLDTAAASYGAFFVVPQVTLGHDLGPLMSSLSLRYAGLFLEAYREHGSSADLAVESRSTHDIASRLQLSVPRTISLEGASLLLEPRLGIDVRAGLGDEDVAIELLGADLEFDVASEEPVLTFFSGASATFRSAEGTVSFRLSSHAAVGSDGSTIVSAALGGEIAF
jgi:outer membrane autotransporter protein